MNFRALKISCKAELSISFDFCWVQSFFKDPKLGLDFFFFRDLKQKLLQDIRREKKPSASTFSGVIVLQNKESLISKTIILFRSEYLKNTMLVHANDKKI